MPNRFRKLPPQETIKEWLEYKADTGGFFWIKDPIPHAPRLLHKKAGTVRPKSGAVFIHIREHGIFAAHRLAWIYVHGHIPEGMEIDHIDCNPNNNAISNLRLATSSQQKMNKRVQSNNVAGLKGAYYHACRKGKKWRSQIKIPGRYVFLGYYSTALEAHEAYGKAAREHFGEFARAA